MPKKNDSKKQEKNTAVPFPRHPKHVVALCSTPAGKKRYKYLVASFKKAKNLKELEAIWMVELPYMNGKELKEGLKPQVITYAFSEARGIPTVFGNTQMKTRRAIAKANPRSK